jgi:MoaA/NifB/PqqE/SkfB family radical SAM enzyme
VNGEIAEVFSFNAVWLRVSIDGWDSRSYAEYRDVSEDEFGKVMRNIESFKTLGGKCYLGISIIVDRKNAGHIFELASRLKDAGANSVKIAPCIVSNSGSENNEYHAPIFAAVKAETRKAIERLSDNSFEVYDSYHGQLESFKKSYTWCPYLQVLPVIGADQNIYPCQDKAYNLENGLLGSIKEKSFRDFWFSDKNIFFKINPSVHCNHHCVADPKNKLLLEYLGADENHLGFV